MAVIVDVPSVVGGGDFTDFTVPAAGSTDNGKVWAWNSGTSKFAPVTTLTSYTLVTPTIASFVNATHDHSNAAGGGTLTITGYLPTTGATAGGTSSRQQFTSGIKIGTLQPISDGATAFQVQSTGGTVALNVDTTNNRVGFGGNVAPAQAVDATGSVKFSTALIGPVWGPASDSTTALKVAKADLSTTVLNIDTTNSRVQLGTTTAATLGTYAATLPLEVNGPIRATRAGVPTQYLELLGLGTGLSGPAVHAYGSVKPFTFFNESSSAINSSFYTAFYQGATGSIAEVVRWDYLNNMGLGTNSPTARLHIAGGFSQAAWGSLGVLSLHAAATFTNTSTAAAGTVATTVANSFGIPTFASTNAITSTDNATVYIDGAPAAGTNTTITRAYGLWVKGGTKLEGNVGVFGTNPTTQQTVTGSRGSNAALASLLTALAAYGLIVDSSS